MRMVRSNTRAQIRERLREISIDTQTLAETLVLAVPPLLLLALHVAIPQTVASSFYFYPANPIGISVWSATLFHSSWGHLLGNIAAYTLTIPLIYTLYRRWRNRRKMWLLLGFVAISAPPVIGIVDVLVLREYAGAVTPDTNLKGFSGIVNALAGILWASLGGYVNTRTDTQLGAPVTVSVVMLTGIVWAVTYRPDLVTVLAVTGLSILGLILIASRINSHHDRDRFLDEDRELVVLSGLVIIWVVTSGLPPDWTTGATVTNVVAHLTGLVYGFTVTRFVLSDDSLLRMYIAPDGDTR